jgi:hypothetical protein
LEFHLKKIIILIFLFTFNAYGDPIKKCTDHYGKELAKQIGASAIATVANVVYLGILVEKTIPIYKNTHEMNKIFTTLNEIRNNRKWGLGFRKFASDLGITGDEVLSLAKKKPELLCNNRILSSQTPYKSVLSEVRSYLTIEERIKKYKGTPFIKSWVSLEKPFQTLDKSTYNNKIFFKNCQVRHYGNHSAKTLRSKAYRKKWLTYKVLAPKCAPEVVFNWSGPGMLSYLKKLYNNRSINWNAPIETRLGEGNNPNALFTSFSPLATYGYGSENLRIKLKKGTKFYFIIRGNAFTACNAISPKEKKTTVMVRPFHIGNKAFVEYLLCSFGPVHSWSYGQEETFNEEVRQYNFIQKYPRQTKYILYMHRDGIPELYLGNLDGIDFGPSLLWERITNNLSKLMVGMTGEIFYNPDIPKSEKNPYNHFKLDKPISWKRTK